MQEIRLLIEKFWAGTATPEEKKRLFKLMQDKGLEWQHLLESEYRQELNSDQHSISSGPSGQLLEQLHRQIESETHIPALQNKRMLQLRPWMRWAAAAAIITGITLGVYRLIPPGKRPADLAAKEIKATRRLRQQVNGGKTAERLVLEDGSVIDLYPGSGLTYYEPFSNTRNISLYGKAQFNVARKPGAPFSVHTGGFITTALGTTFIVNTLEDSQVSMVLIEGSIFVHATPESGMPMKDVYLTPGQELAINSKVKNYALREWKAAGATANNIRRLHRAPSADDAFVFNKTPLAKVFQQLADHYKMRIIFDGPDVAGLSFTGSIKQTDDLQAVLSIICNTNDLTFSSGNGEINISKQKQP